jgi:hypothetical protein
LNATEPRPPFALLVVASDGKVLTARSYLSDQETLDRLGLLTGR